MEYVPRHVYTLRHCERLDDVNKVWYFNDKLKKDNTPLSDRGLMQASQVADRLRHVHFDYAFSSPYERCVQTANPILDGRKLKLNIEPGLLESASLCERKKYGLGFEKANELATRYGMINVNYKPLFEGPCKYEWDMGPNEGCIKRVTSTLKNILAKCQGDILIIGHMSSLAAINSLLCSEEVVYSGQATISKFVENPDIPETFYAEFQCDCSHLSDYCRQDLRGRATIVNYGDNA